MVLLAPSTLPEHNPTRPPLHGAVYFTPTTKSDILPLTDSILHCCTNFTFYRFNSRQSLFSPAALFPLEFPGESRARFKFPPFHIQLRSLKAKGMQGVNLECCQTLLLLETGLLAPESDLYLTLPGDIQSHPSNTLIAPQCYIHL